MIERRDFLKLVLGGLAGPIGVLVSDTKTVLAAGQDSSAQPLQFRLGDPTPFDPTSILELARRLSKQPSKPLATELPNGLRNLDYEKYVTIRERSGTAIWSAEKTGFALEPLQRGALYSSPMEISLVEEGKARRILYDPALYDF
ncbi:MAG: glucan biosynthesis protein, partial [Alphaproteobacteria bacterium]|nr:glucan biosynthesis protein [Alphaproteobacteria bacterium]